MHMTMPQTAVHTQSSAQNSYMMPSTAVCHAAQTQQPTANTPTLSTATKAENNHNLFSAFFIVR
jgi:hypothetical protein